MDADEEHVGVPVALAEPKRRDGAELNRDRDSGVRVGQGDARDVGVAAGVAGRIREAVGGERQAKEREERSSRARRFACCPIVPRRQGNGIGEITDRPCAMPRTAYP